MKRFKKASIIFLMFMLLSVIAMPVSASAAKLNKTSISLNVGKTYTLKVTGNKGKITWTSSNKSVATVSSKGVATVYKGNIIKNLIMDCQSYTKYRPNETTGGIFVSWRRKEELPTGA